jgi:hypothetical protein
MVKVPASISQQDVHYKYDDIEPCVWQDLPESGTALLPNVRQIDFEVVVPAIDFDDEVEFNFDFSSGVPRGKQSKKEIDEVTLVTGREGAIFYINYQPRRGRQDILGMWCGWNGETEFPGIEQLLPDELGNIHVKPNGGMVFRTAWNIGEPPRGLVLILCGLGGLQHSSRVLGNELLEDGWAIVYVYTAMNAPDYKTDIELSDEKHYSTFAIELFDIRFCQVIGATKAIRHHMEQQLPSLESSPFALIGISAGALNLPAVYHEMKEDVDAVVLIAGGANMFDIVQEGAFTKWKFTHDGGDTFTNDELRKIGTEYLNQLSRDPYHLASGLPHDKTLIVHAKYDAVVPAENGDLLWERAGYPERWVFSGGHLGLFMIFDKHSKEIAKWLDSKIN